MLSWDVSVPKDAIQVKVEKGWLTLSGEVDWNFQRSAAMDDVRKLSGVMGCTNLIHIKSRVQVPDLQKRIEDALKRCAELEAKTIRVSVKDGEVTLEGRVRAWSERDARNPQFGAPRGSRLSRTASRSAVEARLKSDRWGQTQNFRANFQLGSLQSFRAFHSTLRSMSDERNPMRALVQAAVLVALRALRWRATVQTD